MNIQYIPLPCNAIHKKIKRFLSRYAIHISLITILILSTFFVGRASADEPEKISFLNQQPEQYLIAKPATTTTTTTTVPVQKIVQKNTPKITAPPAAVQTYETGSIQQMIVDSANRHGLDPNRMLRIAKCESGFNPGSVAKNLIDGTHPTGLYQHVAKYWPARATKYGFDGASIFDANAQIEVTMGMFRDGGASAWACK